MCHVLEFTHYCDTFARNHSVEKRVEHHDHFALSLSI